MPQRMPAIMTIVFWGQLCHIKITAATCNLLDYFIATHDKKLTDDTSRIQILNSQMALLHEMNVAGDKIFSFCAISVLIGS